MGLLGLNSCLDAKLREQRNRHSDLVLTWCIVHILLLLPSENVA